MQDAGKRVAVLTAIAVSLLFAQISSGEEKEAEAYNDYSAKYFGVIEKMPEKNSEGLWIVNDKEIVVTTGTEIEEEYGKAEVGAYVEITGDFEGKDFNAHRIEVKMQKKGE